MKDRAAFIPAIIVEVIMEGGPVPKAWLWLDWCGYQTDCLLSIVH